MFTFLVITIFTVLVLKNYPIKISNDISNNLYKYARYLKFIKEKNENENNFDSCNY